MAGELTCGFRFLARCFVKIFAGSSGCRPEWMVRFQGRVRNSTSLAQALFIISGCVLFDDQSGGMGTVPLLLNTGKISVLLIATRPVWLFLKLTLR